MIVLKQAHRKMLRTLAAITLFCGLVFGIDIALELHFFLIRGTGLAYHDIVHLGLESFATLLLFVGFVLTGRYMRQLRAAEAHQARKLDSLRGQFDDILHEKFAEWGLSRAESDIALLSLRGLKITEIANLRQTKDGTIKAQFSAIFRKAGVATRGELTGLFMDEFLDFGAAASLAKT